VRGGPIIEHQIREIVEELSFIQERFFKRSSDEVVRLAQRIADTFRNQGRLLVFGTGISGHISQILASSLIHRVAVSRPPLPAIALTADGALLSGIAEDRAPEEVFSRQIEALGRNKQDMALAISCDGDSPATLRGLVRARESGLETAAILGKDGGKMKNYTELSLVVEAERPARVHEVHLIAVQVLAQIVERKLFSL
jgi:D-sedoheptulose 7-phosphate isomerase